MKMSRVGAQTRAEVRGPFPATSIRILTLPCAAFYTQCRSQREGKGLAVDCKS